MITKIKYKDHTEWLEVRSKYLGGSDSASVVGMNPYKSMYSLWAEKTNKVPAFEGNLTTEVGSYLEEFVAKLFEKETGKKVRKCNYTMVNDKYPFACANVDRLIVGEDALLEIKTTNSLPTMKKCKNGEFPDAWYAQMTHYLSVLELKKAYLAVLVNCREFYIFELERDEDEINALMKAEADFWNNYVLTNTPPMADGTDSTSETLKTIYPESNGETVSLMAFESDLEQYMTLSSLLDDVKKQKEEVANKIKGYMQEASKGECNGFKVSWSSSVRSTFDHKAFAKDNPGIDLSGYYKETPTRTFKVNEIK